MQPAAARRAHDAPRIQPQRGREPVRRPGRGRGAHDLLRAQPPRRRADLPVRAQAAGGDLRPSPIASRPTAPATRRSSGARSSATSRAASCWAWSRPTRSSWASTSATSTRRCRSRSPGPSRACASSGGAPGAPRRGGLAMYVAGDDALDQFFCRHPEEFLDRPVEAAILDHCSEMIYMNHLCVAAYEGPLEPADEETLGPGMTAAADRLVAAGRLRRRGGRYHPRDWQFPAAKLSLRSASPDSFTIVEAEARRGDRLRRGRARLLHRPSRRRVPPPGRALRGRGARHRRPPRARAPGRGQLLHAAQDRDRDVHRGDPRRA